MVYHELTTQKIWEEKALQEYRAIRRQKGRDAVQNVIHFLYAILIMLATYWAIITMPEWLPLLTEYVQETGLVERFQSGAAIIKYWFNSLRF